MCISLVKDMDLLIIKKPATGLSDQYSILLNHLSNGPNKSTNWLRLDTKYKSRDTCKTGFQFFQVPSALGFLGYILLVCLLVCFYWPVWMSCLHKICMKINTILLVAFNKAKLVGVLFNFVGFVVALRQGLMKSQMALNSWSSYICFLNTVNRGICHYSWLSMTFLM